MALVSAMPSTCTMPLLRAKAAGMQMPSACLVQSHIEKKLSYTFHTSDRSSRFQDLHAVSCHNAGHVEPLSRAKGGEFLQCQGHGCLSRLTGASHEGRLDNSNRHRLGFRAPGRVSRRRVEAMAGKEPGKKKQMSIGDQLLDYIEGGPKLRKWYGAGELLPRDGAVPSGGQQQEEVEGEAEDEGPRDAVLVTDADGPTGQLVVLSLILRRARVRALVRDVKAAVAAFGPYVEPILGDVSDGASVDKALRGVRAVIAPSKLGLIAGRAKQKKVEHVVLLSQVGVDKGAGEGWGAILGALTRRQLADAEAEVAECGVPYTIVRAGALRDEPGGKLGLQFGQGDVVRGAITREDAATVCVRALDAPPEQSLVFEVVNGNGKVLDWSGVFESLQTPAAPTSSGA